MRRVKYADMRERILSRTVTSDAPAPCGDFCWLWLGPTKPNGYGTLSVRWKRGPRKGKVRTLMVHRESVKAFTGRAVRADYVVRHRCNTPWCVNPAHLIGGTHRQNTQDMIEAGRHWSPFLGQPSPRSKEKCDENQQVG